MVERESDRAPVLLWAVQTPDGRTVEAGVTDAEPSHDGTCHRCGHEFEAREDSGTVAGALLCVPCFDRVLS